MSSVNTEQLPIAFIIGIITCQKQLAIDLMELNQKVIRLENKALFLITNLYFRSLMLDC